MSILDGLEYLPKRNRSCFVYGCFSTAANNPNLGFHKFPIRGKRNIVVIKKNGDKCIYDRRQVWIEALNIGREAALAIDGVNVYVCSLHFARDDFYYNQDITGRRYLKEFAIPRRNLPARNTSPLSTKFNVRSLNRVTHRGYFNLQNPDGRKLTARRRFLGANKLKEATVSQSYTKTVWVVRKPLPSKDQTDQDEVRKEGADNISVAHSFSLANNSQSEDSREEMEEDEQCTIVGTETFQQNNNPWFTSELIIKEEPVSDSEQESSEPQKMLDCDFKVSSPSNEEDEDDNSYEPNKLVIQTEEDGEEQELTHEEEGSLEETEEDVEELEQSKDEEEEQEQTLEEEEEQEETLQEEEEQVETLEEEVEQVETLEEEVEHVETLEEEVEQVETLEEEVEQVETLEEEEEQEGIEEEVEQLEQNQVHNDEPFQELTEEEEYEQTEIENFESFDSGGGEKRKESEQIEDADIGYHNGQSEKAFEQDDSDVTVVHVGDTNEEYDSQGGFYDYEPCEICGEEECDGHPQSRDNYFVCLVCSEIFSSQEELASHSVCHQDMSEEEMLLHEDRRLSLTCQFCRRVLSTKATLREHIMIHTGEKPHECLLCGKSFRHKANLVVHVNGHAVVSTYKCKKCNKAFTKKMDFEKHLKFHVDASGNPLVCKICNAVFKSQRTLYNHSQLHSRKGMVRAKKRSDGPRDPIHVCQTCGKVLSTKATLKEHMMIHSGEKPHVCTICGRTIRHKANFVVHIQTHGQGKSYECDMCDEAFMRKSDLTQHKQVSHSKSKLLRCPICSEVFKSPMKFNRHMEIHESVVYMNETEELTGFQPHLLEGFLES